MTFASPPVRVGNTAVKTLKEGTGEASTGGGKVSVRQALFLGKHGKLVQTDFESKDTRRSCSQGTDRSPGSSSRCTASRPAPASCTPSRPPTRSGNGRAEAGIGRTDNLVVLADVVSVGTSADPSHRVPP